MKPSYSENKIEVGIDEVARGCLFGPVYAAAVRLNPDIPQHMWLNDSKKVTKKRRKVVSQWIMDTSLDWAVSSVSNETIDTINIKNATILAMQQAVAQLKVKPELLVVDGNYFESEIDHVCVISGDSIYANIAAASILAKEHHDDYIKNLVSDEPMYQENYDLAKNMGYGTSNHIIGIKTVGITELHRKSFLTRILPGIVVKKQSQILFLDEK